MFDKRYCEAIAHLFVFTALMIQFAPEYKVIQSFANVGWIVCYAIGYFTEGIRVPQAAAGLVYLMMTTYYFIHSSFATQQFESNTLGNILLTLLAAIVWC